MVRSALFTKVGGMDEQLPMEFNDIDFCLKLYAVGYYTVYLPSVTLFHYESATRGHPYLSKKAWRQRQHDLSIFKLKWSKWIANDPFYNRHLSRLHTDCSIGNTVD
jgi:GT2 family glycosyltransferase